MRLLLVEDDVRVASALAPGLRRRGYLVEHAETAAAALAARPADLVLLDLNLPDGDGLSVCRALRSVSPGVGIIVLTARSEERDRVVGLRSGADDYVVKPFSMAELQARIEAVLRRAQWTAPPSTVMSLGPLTIDVGAREVRYQGREITLTRKEFEVLLSLARQPGVAVPRDRILMDVWQTTWRGGHTLEVHIGSLRAKLGADDLVQTVRGVGYRLKAC